jgi:hypothetical protein
MDWGLDTISDGKEERGTIRLNWSGAEWEPVF